MGAIRRRSLARPRHMAIEIPLLQMASYDNISIGINVHHANDDHPLTFHSDQSCRGKLAKPHHTTTNGEGFGVGRLLVKAKLPILYPVGLRNCSTCCRPSSIPCLKLKGLIEF